VTTESPAPDDYTDDEHKKGFVSLLDNTALLLLVFTAQHYASAVCTVILSFCLSVCLLQASIVPKQLNLGSHK